MEKIITNSTHQKNKRSDIKCAGMDITVLTTNGYHDLDFFSIEVETIETVAQAFYSLILWAPTGVCNFVVKSGEMGEGEKG